MAQQLPQIHSVHSSQRRPAHGSARPAAPSLLARVPWGFLAVIAEMRASRSSERQGRLIDRDQAGSMEKKKQEGYF